MLGLAVDPTSGSPPFEQLRAQLADRIRDGRLPAGTRLPAVRALAEEAGVAVNTAARTVKELEAEGLVETRGRNGTVVAWSPDAAVQELERAAAAFAALARAQGVDPPAALALVARALGPPA
jgi:DNA-binding transcriptional regulator YhcF (GntR family)